MQNTLTVVRPNYYWTGTEDYETADFVRLAYEVYANNESLAFHVDAVTNEIIGGNVAMAEKAGAYGQTDSNYLNGTKGTTLAKNGMTKLGYTTTQVNNDTATLKTNITTFWKGSDSFGFFFRGHGSSSTIAAQKDSGATTTWRLYSTDAVGYWHFVFLDACSTGANRTWANAFQITSGAANRGFLGWYDTVWTDASYEFATYFWPKVNTMTLNNAAVQAANLVPGNGTTPIRYYGDIAYYGKAWS